MEELLSNPHFRSLTIGLTTALMLPLLLYSQSCAATNVSGEVMRLAHENYCADLWVELKFAEGLAKDFEGISDSDSFSQDADDAFAKAEKAGCEWARWTSGGRRHVSASR